MECNGEPERIIGCDGYSILVAKSQRDTDNPLMDARARQQLISDPDHFDVEAWSLQEARHILQSYLAGSGIEAWLFGSRARKDNRRMSDIDIALRDPDGPIDRALLASLADAFEESEIPYTVDLVDLATVDPEFQAQVQREGIPWIH